MCFSKLSVPYGRLLQGRRRCGYERALCRNCSWDFCVRVFFFFLSFCRLLLSKAFHQQDGCEGATVKVIVSKQQDKAVGYNEGRESESS